MDGSAQLLGQVDRLINDCLAFENAHKSELAAIPDRQRASAQNLLHYLAVRQRDLRELQLQLAELGLSSLGRMEGHVLATLSAVSGALSAIAGRSRSSGILVPPVSMRGGSASLQEHAAELFGPPSSRPSRIMVTMPSEAGTDPGIISTLVQAGMDVMRINGAHDGPETWRSMVNHLQAARETTGRHCRIFFDLGGPKARTSRGDGIIRLRVGDSLVVTKSQLGPAEAATDADGRVVSLPSVGCSLPEIVDSVQPGHAIWFDDGKIGGVVSAKHADRFQVTITAARGGSAKLRGDKGINLPESDLLISGLTPKDRLDLDFASAQADIVGLSFVRDPDDVSELIDLLCERRAEHLGIVLKIETRRGFQNLPRLLLTALRSPPLGVMVARGDLGVELGFERLAEVQEEILWLAEAAHVPVIWATQVLDSLARKGLPSRAEVTDAAMAGRAECVMLNKGPMVVPAVKFLDDILTRMTLHQNKKMAMLRPLGVSQMF